MDSQLVEIDLDDWSAATPNEGWITALEAGKVLMFPRLGFDLSAGEHVLLTPTLLAPKVRNISLDAQGRIKGVAGDAGVQQAAAAMVGRFRAQAQQLIHGLLPHYTQALRLAPTSYRPAQVETRVQSWRADDKRMHVDAFPSRPNYGERILRVFTNVNPAGTPRVWRVGEPFEDVARRFLPRVKPYVGWQAKLLRALRVTKSLRSEYDHLMLQLHDAMKADVAYQQNGPQQRVPFPAGSVWICFSDQTSHAVMSGQYMLEQTLHLPAARQYNPESSPLAILSRLTGRPLV
ncbi:MAG: Kdo hydroxylase family protein [Pseudomonadota bacterium]